MIFKVLGRVKNNLAGKKWIVTTRISYALAHIEIVFRFEYE